MEEKMVNLRLNGKTLNVHVHMWKETTCKSSTYIKETMLQKLYIEEIEFYSRHLAILFICLFEWCFMRVYLGKFQLHNCKQCSGGRKWKSKLPSVSSGVCSIFCLSKRKTYGKQECRGRCTFQYVQL